MKVLSLFDGMSCGMLAMMRAGIDVDRYVAYEVDKFAVKTSLHNFPMIEQCGDVFGADFTQYDGFDFLVGGSPCTHWSIAQGKNRETTASGIGWELFSQYVRALEEAKPRYFIYENNKSMSKEIKRSITDTFGFEPICINSALVSAQNRNRLYWVGIRCKDGTYKKANLKQPNDRGIMLKQIIDSGNVDRDKSLTVAARYAGFQGCQSYLCRRYFGKSFGQAVFDGDIAEIKEKWEENPYFESNDKNIRQMTVNECKRLQTVPEWYEFPVSDLQAYKMLGNGWTVEVIAHLINCIKESVDG